jgi:hypothetical protein
MVLVKVHVPVHIQGGSATVVSIEICMLKCRPSMWNPSVAAVSHPQQRQEAEPTSNFPSKAKYRRPTEIFLRSFPELCDNPAKPQSTLRHHEVEIHVQSRQ